MSELTTSHLVLYAVLIIATMAVLDWLESRRSRIARAPTAPRAGRRQTDDTASGAHVGAPPPPYDRIEEDSMKGLGQAMTEFKKGGQ